MNRNLVAAFLGSLVGITTYTGCNTAHAQSARPFNVYRSGSYCVFVTGYAPPYIAVAPAYVGSGMALTELKCQ